MSLKFKIVFYNLMAFLVIFDILYLLTWILNIQTFVVRALIASGIAVLFTPWASSTGYSTGKKVLLRSYARQWYKKHQQQKSNQEIE